MVALSLVLLTASGFCGAPFLTGAPSQSAQTDSSAGGIVPPPSIGSLPAPPEPTAFVGKDFLISYDDDWDAFHPAVATTPRYSLDASWDGSIHSVWEEQNESDQYTPHLREIHYSMSLGASGGREWSNDEPSEGDRIISNTGKGKETASAEGVLAPAYNPGDSADPAIAVDMFGYIHVVWRELMSDGYWEIMYSHSEDNGKTWTGFDQIKDIYVSNKTTNRNIPYGPAIAVSNDKSTGKVILHVIWIEDMEKTFEVYYSRSLNNGMTWSSATAPDIMISDSTSQEPAGFPTIAASEKYGKVIHAAWLQNDPDTGQDEIFATTSTNFGSEWPKIENIVSLKGKDGLNAGAPSLAGSYELGMVTWSQPFKDPAAPGEIHYSFTGDFGASWSGTKEDVPISYPDGESAINPSVTMAYNGYGYVAWTERDQNKWGSIEVHVSESKDITKISSWTGREGDNVISPMTANADGVPANAGNVSVAYSLVGTFWRPHVVWDEVNYTKQAGRVNDNWEINYVPPVDFSIPVGTGWNLLSVPLEQESTLITTVLSDVGDGTTTWDRALWYDPSDAANHWKQYNTGWSSSLNDLATVDHTICLWVNVTDKGSDGMLTVTGTLPTSTSIYLYPGWNMVGYPAQVENGYTVASLKSDTGATMVEGFNASATYKTSILPDSYTLLRGRGYWIYVPAGTTWVVDW
ncbi:MAG: exo-alpha-sialidase [Euryarchaeota archaeon]|nr:exo-alpha-sialidase [Euryarchaeota archaeon]